MDDKQALAILSALANGANPQSGEIFPADSLYQSPNVIRALYVAQRALESKLAIPDGNQSVRPARSAAGARPAIGNAGKPWSDEEDKLLLAAFDAGRPLTEIAGSHGRTIGGVRARLEKHGRLEPSAATRWPARGDAVAQRSN